MSDSGERRQQAKQPDDSHDRIDLEWNLSDDVRREFKHQRRRYVVEKDRQTDAGEQRDDARCDVLFAPFSGRFLFSELN